MLDYYLRPNAIANLHKSCERNKIDIKINKQTVENCGPINNIIDETNAERTKLWRQKEKKKSKKQQKKTKREIQKEEKEKGKGKMKEKNEEKQKTKRGKNEK